MPTAFAQGTAERLWSDRDKARPFFMIRNGLYHITVEFLDGVSGSNQGVMVLRDGQIRGGDSFFYASGDETAEGDGIALAGKQSIRFRSKLRLLIQD